MNRLVMNELPSRSPSLRRRPSIKRLLAVLAFCLVLGGGVQWVTAINDNSTRNVVTLLACGIAVMAVAIWSFRTLALRLPLAVAALLTLAILFSPAIAFRLRGFTGEIIPQLEFRFSSNRSLRTDAILSDTAGDAAHMAQASFAEFLGPDRNAVIARRWFDVPQPSPTVAERLEPLWQQAVGEGWSSFAIDGNRCVTLEQRGQEECVTCYRLSDGALLWINASQARHQNRLGGIGPRSTPTIAGDRVYTQGATGIVQCLDLASGGVIWRQELLELAGWSQVDSEKAINWGRAGSPLLIDQLCVLPYGGPDRREQAVEPQGDARPASQGRTLIALDRDDGSVHWTAGTDQISYASPMRMTLAGTDQIVSVNERSVSGHAIDDGRQLWSVPWHGRSNGSANCAAALRVDDHAFLVGKAYGTGSGVFEIAADAEGVFSVSERWKRSSVLKTKFTHACIANGFAYGLSDGMLECVDLTNGKRMWAQPRGARYGHGQVILVEDVLVVQSESGEVAFVTARNDQFEELGTLPALDSKTWNIPTIAGRYLAVRNDAQAMVYQLPQRSDSAQGTEDHQQRVEAGLTSHRAVDQQDSQLRELVSPIATTGN